jgi:hypothetical protein
MPIVETMERKKPRRRRSFTPAFKAKIVERCRASPAAGEQDSGHPVTTTIDGCMTGCAKRAFHAIS